MMNGNRPVLATSLFLLILIGMMVPAAQVGAQTQTPDAACAADSLYLISPDAVHMIQQAVGRPGLVISWEDLDTGEATCYTLRNSEGLGFGVDVTGGFGDQVDRVLNFTTPDSGSIGHQINEPLVVNWQSSGHSSYGVLAGVLNLANNGGILRLDTAANQWGQVNGNLPMTWRNTNVVALAQGSQNFQVAAFTAGQSLDTNPTGLYLNSGSGWNRIAEDVFDGNVLVSCLAVSATDNNRIAVGTARSGLFITTDGGETFTQYQNELDPGAVSPPGTWTISAVNWDSGRLFTFVPNFGLFYTSNSGTSFTRSPLEIEENLDVDPGDRVIGPPNRVNDLVVNANNPDHILAALNFNGVFQSFDGGDSWSDMYGDLLVPDPDNAGAWSYSAYSVAVDPANSQVVVAGMVQKGLYRTADGGATWALVGDDMHVNISLNALRKFYLRPDPAVNGRLYCLEDNHKVLHSDDFGAVWDSSMVQPFLPSGLSLMVSRDGSGDLLMGSWGGGIYEPGSDLNLSESYTTTTSDYLRNLDLGLDINFEAGTVQAMDAFTLVCQTFQGWAVWRAPGFDPDNMTLLGLYDRVNPEACIEGYCGDDSYDLVPQCYVSKRAACFDFSTPDSVRFFDDEVYNGFSYHYAVSAFDYGNTATTSPQNNSNTMLFSPRWSGDELSPFMGDGNRVPIQINLGTADPKSGEEIYVYPNPLRRDTGIPGQEGGRMTFTNLPPDSRVRIFTTAGDDVNELLPETQVEGNMHWATTNRSGELVASGVYLYKVIMPEREDYWGRLVIIR